MTGTAKEGVPQPSPYWLAAKGNFFFSDTAGMGGDGFADRQRAGSLRVTPDSLAPAKARGVTQNRWQQAGPTATPGDWHPANPAGHARGIRRQARPVAAVT